jgi:hypothetical protein
MVLQCDPALADPCCVTGLEETDLDGVRVSGVDGEVNAGAGGCGTKGGREISRGAHGLKGRQSLR